MYAKPRCRGASASKSVCVCGVSSPDAGVLRQASLFAYVEYAANVMVSC